MDRAHQGPYKKERADILPVWPRASLVNKRFIKWLSLPKNLQERSCGIIWDSAGPILIEYWSSNGAIWLVDFSHRPSELTWLCSKHMIFTCCRSRCSRGVSGPAQRAWRSWGRTVSAQKCKTTTSNWCHKCAWNTEFSLRPNEILGS